MTRFARARGSKASNERAPEEATSWTTMKQQLLQSQERNKTQDYSILKTSQYFKNSLNTTKTPVDKVWESFDCNKTKKSPSKNISKNRLNETEKVENRKNEFPKHSKLMSDEFIENKTDSSNFTVEEKFRKKANKKNNKKLKKCLNEMGTIENGKIKSPKTIKLTSNEHSVDNSNDNTFVRKKNQKASRKNNIAKVNSIDATSKNSLNETENFDNGEIKSSKKRKLMLDEHNVNKNYNNSNNTQGKIKQISNKKKNMNGFGKTNLNTVKSNKTLGGFVPFNPNKNEPFKKEGRFIKTAHFQGFEVKKEDAIRLEKLRNDLKKQGVPKKQLEIALKSERRRAEKALSREKKSACYKCRKFGHNMSECPEFKESNGMCFKCGSTEHTSRECRVIKGDSFGCASCFICQEQGHIARQCPDNPKGIYPKGGACKICGDVTHFKKDCPQLIDEKEKNTITIGMVQNNSIEDLDEELSTKIDNKKNIKKKSLVKF